MAIVQYAVLNDIHFPYESPKYKKALSIIESFPDLKHIYLNGDIAEIESVSSHPKTPNSQKSLMAEMDYINSRFDEIEKTFKKVPVTLIEGNHCYRIFRYIRDVCPELWGLLHTPELFKFPKRQWKFIPYSPTQWQKCGDSNLFLRHEPLVGGVNHAKGTAEKATVDVLYGHTHVFQQFTHKKLGPDGGKLVTATSGGWLGDITQRCFDYRGNKDNWREMFTRIDCDEKSGKYELRPIFL